MLLDLDVGVRPALGNLFYQILNLGRVESLDFGCVISWDAALLDVMNDLEADASIASSFLSACRALELSVDQHPDRTQFCENLRNWVSYLMPALRRIIDMSSTSENSLNASDELDEMSRSSSLSLGISEGFAALASLAKLGDAWHKSFSSAQGQVVVSAILDCIVDVFRQQIIQDNGQFVAATALVLYMDSFVPVNTWIGVFGHGSQGLPIENATNGVNHRWLTEMSACRQSWNEHAQLSLYQALISSARPATLQSIIPGSDDSLYEALFSRMFAVCSSPQNATIRTYALFAIGVWLDASKRMDSYNGVRKCLTPAVYRKLFDYTLSLWDATSDAAVAKLTAVLDGLLDAAVRLMSDDDLAGQIILDVLKIDWEVKAKYEILGLIQAKFGIGQLLKIQPDLFDICFENMKNRKIAMNIRAFVVRCLRHHMNSLTVAERQPSAMKFWLQPLSKALVSDNHNVRKVLSEAVLPDIIRNAPEAAECLLAELEALGSPLKVSAQFAIYKSLRFLGLESHTSSPSEITLLSAIVHADMNTRIDALGYICEGSKGLEEIDEVDLNAVKKFLVANGAIQSADFRQRFSGYFKKILHRIRRTVYANWRDFLDRQVVIKSASSQQQVLESQIICDELQSKLNMKRDFLEWILSFAIYNTYPGATFQRKESALALLQHYQESEKGFKTSVLLDFRIKTSPFNVNMNTTAVVEALITTLLHDKYTPTRIAAFELLAGLEGELAGYELEQLVKLSTSLMSSKRYSQAESGALLMHLVAIKYGREMKREIHVATSTSATEYSPYDHVMVQVLDLLELQMTDSTSWTISFGLLIALKHLLSSVDYIQLSNEKQQKLFAKQSSRMVSIARRACAIAVPSIMEVSLGEGNDEVDVDIDDEGLEVAYAFRVVKESALMLHALLSNVPFPDDIENECFLEVRDIENAADLLREMAVMARHRGAFTAVTNAFETLCLRLLASKSRHLGSLPKRFLDDLLVMMNSDDVGITRRSAGIPDTIVSILTNEATSSRKPLLKYTMFRLLEMIGNSDSDLSSLQSSAFYTCQVHAFNTLRGMVEDSILGLRLTDSMEDLFATCIQGFHSLNFSVRNSAGMMFSRLLNKTMGPKSDSITAHEFFERFPRLKEVFLNELSSAVDALELSGEVVATLYPILTVLTKLKPATSDLPEAEGSEFKALIHRCVTIDKYQVREMAARCLPAFVTPSSILAVVRELLTSTTAKDQNRSHGCLLQAEALLKSWHNLPASRTADALSTLTNILNESAWLYDSNPCPISQAQYLSIVFEHIFAQDKYDDKPSDFQRIIVQHCLAYIESSDKLKRIGEKRLLSVSVQILVARIQWVDVDERITLERLVVHKNRSVRDTAISALCKASRLAKSNNDIARVIVMQLLDGKVHPHSLNIMLAFLSQWEGFALPSDVMNRFAVILSRVTRDAAPLSIQLLGRVTLFLLEQDDPLTCGVLDLFVHTASNLSIPSEPAPSRKSVATIAGSIIPALVHRPRYQVSYIKLCLVLDTLLVDDDMIVRDLASAIVGDLTGEAPKVAPVSREELMLSVLASGTWIQESLLLIFEYVSDLALGSQRADLVIKTELSNETIVFIHESDNLHREALQDAQLGYQALKILLKPHSQHIHRFIDRLEQNVKYMVEMMVGKLDLSTVPHRPELFVLVARHLMAIRTLLVICRDHKERDVRTRVLKVYDELQACLDDFFIITE
ncbi:hypothetical protein SmJEL517_g04444 [Synchytrium microbalum]|uniref:Uncharacterized protein n=1 Tax=Synchytrium microbalum TaxID=1806994 RepID=A0A507C4Q8_9FUNG|nr:uncharacterized protein SmJEL517_g04444 [Synchytrium microbalum]TPX32415.1 hypothetical protein SmJEL517_g04444 [Synchytrium microbalum]